MSDVIRQTTTEWARANGDPFRWYTNTDNHEPPRGSAAGEGWEYEAPDLVRGSGIVLADVSDLKDARNALYLIDDGRTVRPFYVAARHPDDTHLILHPFPVNVNEDGTAILRADDQRPVDYGSWIIGPRRTYHLKVKRS